MDACPTVRKTGIAITSFKFLEIIGWKVCPQASRVLKNRQETITLPEYYGIDALSVSRTPLQISPDSPHSAKATHLVLL